MKITPLIGVMGAEVTGVDLSKPLNASDREQLYGAFLKHLILCVRDQHLDGVGTLLDAARNFSQIKVQHLESYR